MLQESRRSAVHSVACSGHPVRGDSAVAEACSSSRCSVGDGAYAIFDLRIAGLVDCSFVRVAQTVVAADAATSPRRRRTSTACGRARRATSASPEVALINEAIRKGWTDHKLAPSKAATDGEWCRRVYLDLIGRVPTVEELQRRIWPIASATSGAQLVDRLLGDEYPDEYAAQLDDDLDEPPHRPHGRHGAAVARRPRRDAAVSPRGARVQQAVRRDGHAS